MEVRRTGARRGECDVDKRGGSANHTNRRIGVATIKSVGSVRREAGECSKQGHQVGCYKCSCQNGTE